MRHSNKQESLTYGRITQWIETEFPQMLDLTYEDLEFVIISMLK